MMQRKSKKLNSEKVVIKSNTSRNNGNSGIDKKYGKSGTVCKVTFKLSREAVPQAKRVDLAGDFNNWDCNITPMKKNRNGGFSISLDLGTGREYRFRYLIDKKKWENDWHADKYVPNAYGCDDSVVIV